MHMDFALFNGMVPPLQLEYMLHRKDTHLKVQEECVNVAEMLKNCGVKLSMHQVHETNTAGELFPVCYITAQNISKKKLKEKLGPENKLNIEF